DPAERNLLHIGQRGGWHDIELPLRRVAMIGMISIDAVVSENIKMRGTPLLRDPFRAALPISRAGSDIEAGLARLSGGPRLHRGRLLHLKPHAVRPLEVPSCVIGTAPVPFRLRSESDDCFGQMPAQDIRD